jgi:hypothetical protein
MVQVIDTALAVAGLPTLGDLDAMLSLCHPPSLLSPLRPSTRRPKVPVRTLADLEEEIAVLDDECKLDDDLREWHARQASTTRRSCVGRPSSPYPKVPLRVLGEVEEMNRQAVASASRKRAREVEPDVAKKDDEVVLPSTPKHSRTEEEAAAPVIATAVELSTLGQFTCGAIRRRINVKRCRQPFYLLQEHNQGGFQVYVTGKKTVWCGDKIRAHRISIGAGGVVLATDPGMVVLHMSTIICGFRRLPTSRKEAQAFLNYIHYDYKIWATNDNLCALRPSIIPGWKERAIITCPLPSDPIIIAAHPCPYRADEAGSDWELLS